MKKQFTLFFILIFVFGLIPVNSSLAITQNQISAEVQIVCTDGADNWFSGSGTIIDPKGIILTNRHVVEGAYKNICFIGFLESINQEPNFGPKDNPNLAEVKYITTTSDMDAAVLYLDNPNNKTYPYVNIWNSDSSALQFGDKIEVVGYPGIGGSTITYTSGDFSGFGGKSDGTLNYIKTTAPLEHGNSGGAAYNSSGKFIGIPSMVVAGSLNSLSYVLSVNSIKNWLSSILGATYKQEIIAEQPIIARPNIVIQDDVTPPNISKYKPKYGWDTFFYYDTYDENNKTIKMGGTIDNKTVYTGSSHKISLFTSYSNNETWNKTFGYDMVENGSSLYSAYYKYSDSLSGLNSKPYEEQVIALSMGRAAVTPIIDLPDKEGNYYLSIKLKDGAGNVSNEYILTYTYLKERYKDLKTLYFYSDQDYKNLVGAYTVKFQFDGFDYLRCVTTYNNVYVRWEYNNKYLGYVARSFPDDMFALGPLDVINNKNLSLITNSRIALYGINKSTKDDHVANLKICTDKNNSCLSSNGKVTSLLLKPVANNDYYLEGKNTVVKFHYVSSLPSSKGIMCAYPDLVSFNAIGEPNYYVVENSNAVLNGPTSDSVSSNKLSGRILLQVESRGEAWYVNTKDGKRYYMKDGAAAYQMMRNFGLGITDVDLAKIPQEGERNNNPALVERMKGKILLQVQARGEAWYVDPKTGYKYYMKDGEAAYSLMRFHSLGITNADLGKIPEGSL